MDSRHYRVLPAVSRSYPRPEGRCLRVTIPFATDRRSKLPFTVRLACLIHAANVHSEPGSNPSIKIFCWKEFLLSYYNHVDPALPISSVTYWSCRLLSLSDSQLAHKGKNKRLSLIHLLRYNVCSAKLSKVICRLTTSVAQTTVHNIALF